MTHVGWNGSTESNKNEPVSLTDCVSTFRATTGCTGALEAAAST